MPASNYSARIAVPETFGLAACLFSLVFFIFFLPRDHWCCLQNTIQSLSLFLKMRLRSKDLRPAVPNTLVPPVSSLTATRAPYQQGTLLLLLVTLPCCSLRTAFPFPHLCPQIPGCLLCRVWVMPPPHSPSFCLHLYLSLGLQET